MNDGELTGQARTHIVDRCRSGCACCTSTSWRRFLNLRRAARADGFDLQAVSRFRDFARQLAIWNGKFSGERPMLDAAGCASSTPSR